MARDYFFANKNNWDNLIGRIIGKYIVYAPFLINDELHYRPVSEETASQIAYNLNRPIQPSKIFFFTPNQKVTDVPLSISDKQNIIIGVSTCDIIAFKVLDKLFLEGEFVEPFYAQKRNDSIIINTDCYQPRDTCFCTVAGNKPFPEEDGFDLNLSQVCGGYLFEVGSEKGKDFIGQYQLYFQTADEEKLKEREKKRNGAINRLNEINKEFSFKQNLQKIVVEGYGAAEVWKESAKNCVACGACNFVCPSCNCFLLVDDKVKERLAKLRFWDSCQFSGFSRVAGGANPRKYIWQKLRNRLTCKFNYKKKNFGFYSCTACGRCRESCTAKIDIREVLRNVESVPAHRS